ncbi:MAG: rhodanese-like domain-containing protein [Candidatus Eiseniibacteriota bacterium]
MSRCVFTACFGALVWFAAGCVPSPPPGSGSAPAAGNPSGYVQRISADQLDGWRGVHYEGLVLDVRGPEEWNGVHGHLDGAVLIPMGELQQRIPEIARFRGKPVLVYCKDGTRSLSAAQTLVSNGFRDVTSLDGGIAAYRQLYPLTP